ncbi:MAG: Gfo/Idh/MocA family oxidoreductase [Paenibacillaceae bacterium]|nr:Gfo/Idh/MocA family oxidoreductase [Paenibacillaceae bacterium]
MLTKVLQVGSGSMGTRRLRDVSARSDVELALLETSDERRQQAQARFGVTGFATMEEALAWGPQAMIISTPPQTHRELVAVAIERGLHFFSEAELFPTDYRVIERAVAEKGIVAAPSNTLLFLPVFDELRRIVRDELDAVHAYSYMLSVDTANWHPGEGKEYYARSRSTNGTREMVVFDLSALSYAFGLPQDASGVLRAGGELGGDREDTWALQLRLAGGGAGHLVVSGGSPQTIRKGAAVGRNGTVEFDLASGQIDCRMPALGIDRVVRTGSIADVLEPTYKREIDTFLGAVAGNAAWPHDYRTACLVAGTLAAAERSARSGRLERVDPEALPAPLPDQYEVAGGNQ